MAISVQQLFKQIQHLDFAAVKRAVSLNPSLVHSKHPKDAHTPLHAVAALGNLQLLKELLHLGASCHEVDCNNEAPLHVAARQGHTALVKELLTDAGRRSCLKIANIDGATPLHLAVMAGHVDVVQALVNAGARTDMRDRAGRTPVDLVKSTNVELADILSHGRQLTPSTGARSVRRTISPALSPPPGKGSRTSNRDIRSSPVSPTGDAKDAPGGETDNKLSSCGSTGMDVFSKQRSTGSPRSSSRSAGKTAAGASGVQDPNAASLELGNCHLQPMHDPYQHPDQNERYAEHCQLLNSSQVTSEAEPGQQQQSLTKQQQQQAQPPNKQSWHHYSPQKSLDAAFSQVQHQPEPPEQAQLLTNHYEVYQQQCNSRPENAATAGGLQKLQGPATNPGAHVAAGQHGVVLGAADTFAASNSVGMPGPMYLQHQHRQQQMRHQSPPQLGPLHKARAAGPMTAGAAAASAMNNLTRSVDYQQGPMLSATPAVQTGSQLPQQNSSLSSLKQQPSSMGAGGSCIVSPEASSGLLQVQAHHPAAATQNSSSVPHAQANSSGVHSHYQEHDLPKHGYEYSGPLFAGANVMHGQHGRRSLSIIPGSGPNTPRQPGGYGLPPAPSNLAALAAAVAANSRVGPLSQPLQLQLNDLAGKVTQLEAWFEAQVELIPEWQKVLAVLQGLKRQLEEQEDKLSSQQLTCCNTSAQVTAVENAQHAQAEVLASLPRQAVELAELRAEQATIKASVVEFGQQISQLQAKLVHQAATEAARNAADECQLRSLQAILSANSARLATIEESQLAALTTGLAANSSRLATLETGMEDVRTVLREQHITAKEAAAAATITVAESASAEPAVTDTVALTSRLLALESSLADLQVTVAELQSANVAAAQQEQTAAGPTSMVKPDKSASGADSEDVPDGCSKSASTRDLEAELAELKARMMDLSTSVYGMGGMTPLQNGAVEDTFLPFMETTSNCLQQHEQQLDAIQTLVPKLESVVAHRAQMCELMQQVAALQTAFNLLTGAKPAGAKDTPTRSGPATMTSGPLAANKAAADYLAMATNMVKLQTQMGALSAAVEHLQQEWDSTTTNLKTEHEAIRSAWESERSRLAAAEREAVRRMADQQRELRHREDRLTQIREAALAEEAARRSQLDSEERVNVALGSITSQQEQFKGQLAGLADATETLKEHLASLQAEVMSSLIDLGPHIAAMAEQEQQREAAADSAAQCGIDVLSSLDNTNPVLEPEAEATPRATSVLSCPLSPAKTALTSPKQAAGDAARSRCTSLQAITWQQHAGDVPTSTALAYAEVTGGVCTVNLLSVPSADTALSGAVASLPTAVASMPPPAAAAAAGAKKGSWLGRHLGSHKARSTACHRYEDQRDDADVALLDQVAATASPEAAAHNSDATAGTGDSGQAVDQSPVKPVVGISNKQLGKWTKPWKTLGFRHRATRTGSTADVQAA